MFRKMYQGGSSRKQGPRLAIREQDDEPLREAYVQPCQWPSEEFMVKAGIKDEFDAYVCNADLEVFMQDKCPQYYHLTDSFVRRSRNGVVLVNLANLNLKIFLLVSLWGNPEK